MKDINLLNVWFVIVIVVFFAELINGPPASLTGPPGSARVLFGLPNSSARRASCSSGAQGHRGTGAQGHRGTCGSTRTLGASVSAVVFIRLAQRRRSARLIRNLSPW